MGHLRQIARPAFVSSLAATRRSTFTSSFVCSTLYIQHNGFSIPKVRRSSLRVLKMEQTTASKKEKKKAARTFSKDIKGNIVWTLRAATKSDVDGISALVEDLLPCELVEGLIVDSPCSVVCEANIKGTKEGEGFSPVIMGVAIVDVNTFLIDDDDDTDVENVEPQDIPVEERKKDARLVTVVVDPEFPDPDVKKKLVLGALKKMKEYNVIEVIHETDNPARIELIKECLFKENGMSELDTPSFICQLINENPDPQKKIS